MMNTTTSVVATGVIVTVGQLSSGQSTSISTIVGAAGAAIGLTLLPDQIAEPLAVVILMVAGFTYLPAIAFKLGFIQTKPPDWSTPLAKRQATRPSGPGRAVGGI